MNFRFLFTTAPRKSGISVSFFNLATKRVAVTAHGLMMLAGCWALIHSAQGAVETLQDRPQNLKYEVDLNQAITRYISVRLKADSQGEFTELMLPTWTPGSYLIREYAKHIDRISAEDSSGQPLQVEKISKNRWRVATQNAGRFTVSYRIFCDEVSVRTNSVNFNRAVLVGAATFMTVPEQMQRPHQVRLVLPKNWQVSSSSLIRGNEAHEYLAEDYDELVDSPIVAGNVVEYPFEVAGVPHYLVNVGQTGDWDHQQATKDLSLMVLEHQKLWGSVPYDRYYFINVFGGGGGLEHDNSCLMMTGNFEIRDTARYHRWLSLASHEFFHAWNIRRLRPKELIKYDYENETYTPSLWVAEGITSYYQDLLLARSGIIQQNDYLTRLGQSIRSLQRTEGRLIQSLRDSSFDTWIKFYRPAKNSPDSEISYYTKGAVVGFLLDIRIRAASAGKNNLDSVMREMWRRYRDEGYSEAEFRQVCSEMAGENLEAWFQSSVDSTEELDYQEAADWLGLEIGNFIPVTESLPAGQSSDSPGRSSSLDSGRARERKWIGIGEFDSPATVAGLADTDELIAINDTRIAAGGIDAAIQRFEVGDPIKVLISRDNQLQEILLVVGAKPTNPNWDLKVTRRPSPDQARNLAAFITPDKQFEESTETETVVEKEELDQETANQSETRQDGQSSTENSEDGSN